MRSIRAWDWAWDRAWDRAWDQSWDRSQENPADGTWVAPPDDMQPSYPSEQVPGLEGPDYVALVIEWNDEEDDSPELDTHSEPSYPRGTIRTIAAVVGALGALLLAAWGIRRLRSA